MLDSVTRRRIDTARDILVGKVPDPKSQVEQITIALIYKFMNDMDAEAEEMGGKRSFFAGEHEKYGWSKLMAPNMGGYDVINLYSEAIQRFDFNPGIPQLFRNIFKNAYLPYRDPETLKSFLKVINDFEYDHSEKLGDAFEYLLSILGSQGEAGQFRTPRHIIDFMVAVIDPKKNDVIIDPACGTAGFLISSYKHIVKQNSSNYDPEKDTLIVDANDISELTPGSNGRYKGDKLTPDERGRLANNIKGYDISPDMVRLSLVNMYLHGFTDPHIHEYDTLTSEDRWNEFGDVIMANPPFMSPKGGIKPHKRFSVQSNRSEVLFVDYIAEHLTPNGRAAVIVPEGIIFQSGNAYKALRKMLVENYLFCVVSLPSGVFNPYSGVKTSILLMDKTLAKRTDKILFVKIENDGFDLGAQRRRIQGSDLPQTLTYIQDYVKSIKNKEVFDAQKATNAVVVDKEKIGTNGDWNLSAERYRILDTKLSKYSKELIKDLVYSIKDGDWIESHDQSSSGIRLIQTGNIGIGEYLEKEDKSKYVNEHTFTSLNCTEVFPGDVLVSRLPYPVGRACIAPVLSTRAIAAVDCTIIRFDKSKLIPELFVYYTKCEKYYDQLRPYLTGSSRTRISRRNLELVQIPVPPLPVQMGIVSEVDTYQKIIDGARQVVENYKPRIKINPAWPMVELGEIANVTSSKRIFQNEYVETGIPFYRTKEIVELNQNKQISLELFISEQRYEEIKRDYDVPKQGDLLVSAVGTIGISWVIPDNRKFYFKDGNLLWIKDIRSIDSKFLKHVLDYTFNIHLNEYIFGAACKALTIVTLKQMKIPLPPFNIQREIVSQIEKEQHLVNANKELIQIYEQKIKDKIASIWET